MWVTRESEDDSIFDLSSEKKDGVIMNEMGRTMGSRNTFWKED